MQPRYFACAPGIQPASTPFVEGEGFYDPAKIYPDSTLMSQPDMCSEARAKYPFNTVLKTQGDILIELDSTEGDRRVHVKHPSGSYILMSEDGTITIYSKNQINATALVHISLTAPIIYLNGRVIINGYEFMNLDNHTHTCPLDGETSTPNSNGWFI